MVNLYVIFNFSIIFITILQEELLQERKIILREHRHELWSIPEQEDDNVDNLEELD